MWVEETGELLLEAGGQGLFLQRTPISYSTYAVIRHIRSYPPGHFTPVRQTVRQDGFNLHSHVQPRQSQWQWQSQSLYPRSDDTDLPEVAMTASWAC